MKDLETLKYPTGRFTPPSEITSKHINAWVEEIAQFPPKFRAAVQGLSNEQLDTPYRSGGWTVRQVVNHVSDSHLNGYIRFKWALTEDNPTIKAYSQAGWANLPDSLNGPVGPSLDLLDAIHRKWVNLFHAMSDSDWERQFFHPESQKNLSLKKEVGLYAWHGNHHLMHVENLKERMDWK